MALGVEDCLVPLLLRATVEVMVYLICTEVACEAGGIMYGIKRVGGGVLSMM